jgi:hypothetical protein
VATGTLEERVQKLESTVQEVQHRLAQPALTKQKSGWRWFVGIYAASPDFDEVVRIGKEWRNADWPYRR